MTAGREVRVRFTTAAQRQLRAIDKPAAMRILAALTDTEAALQ
nr:hypothetical protein [Streptomyces sp. ISL-86]